MDVDELAFKRGLTRRMSLVNWLPDSRLRKRVREQLGVDTIKFSTCIAQVDGAVTLASSR